MESDRWNFEKTSYEEFEFNLPAALLRDLIKLFEEMPTSDLNLAATLDIPEAQGVYQLFYDGELAYVGKTDAESGLRSRLTRHARKTLHRPSLDKAVTFKAVRIMVFTAMDLETQLISHYRDLSPLLAIWNGSGFGSNDPGRERETTNRRPDGFDASHPISIDIPVAIPLPLGRENVPIAQVLASLKGLLPYTFRYETTKNAAGKSQRGSPHPDLLNTLMSLPPRDLTVREILCRVAFVLGSSWQATCFASHVILYKESKIYTYGEHIAGCV